MSSLRLRALSERGEPLEVPVVLEGDPPMGSVILRCPPGAHGIHLPLMEDGEVGHRLEVEARGGDTVTVRLERVDPASLRATSTGRRIFTLPPEDRYEPSPVLSPRGDGALDVALLIDGTTRTLVGGKEQQEVRPLVAEKRLWKTLSGGLVGLLEGLADSYAELRTSVVAFGDHLLPEVQAADLKPRYIVEPGPGSRGFTVWDRQRFSKTLTRIRATSGGDAIDALGEGLAACLHLPWRDDARKLTLLLGDSAGFSLLHPAPPEADAWIRNLDVDSMALRMFASGIETVTFYHDSLASSDRFTLPHQRRLWSHAWDQYRRLASRPELARTTAILKQPEDLMRALLEIREPAGRGPVLGLVESSEVDGSPRPRARVTDRVQAGST